MKKLPAMLLTLTLTAALAVPVLAAGTGGSAPQAAAAGSRIQVDGKAVDAQAVVMVPLRAVAEAAGFTVTWDGSLPGARVDNGAAHIDLTLGADRYQLISSAAIGMSAPFSLGAAPAMLEDGVIYVPVELFRVLLGGRDDAVSVENGVVAIHTGKAELVNPLHAHKTPEALQTAVGFSFTVPTPPAGYSPSLYQDISGTVADIRWTNEETLLSCRVSRGDGDNSGDYTTYAASGTLTVQDVSVRWRGENGAIHVAVWENGGLAYSLSSDSGLTEPQVRQMVESAL